MTHEDGKVQPLISDETLDVLTGWPLACLCWAFVIYVVWMRLRWR